MKISYTLLFLILLFWSCKNYSSEKTEEKDIITEENEKELKNVLSSDIATKKTGAAKDAIEVKSGSENKAGTISSTVINDTECSRCEIQIVLALDKQMDNVSYELLYKFLCTFDQSCSNNVEYSQFSNEVLYKAIEMHPGAIVEILSDHPELKREYIYKELSSPLLDYDYNSIIKSLKRLDSGNEEVKNRVIKSVEDALAG